MSRSANSLATRLMMEGPYLVLLVAILTVQVDVCEELLNLLLVSHLSQLLRVASDLFLNIISC